MNLICVGLVVLTPAFLSVFAWAEVLRYSKIRIDELGLDEKSARAGSLSESGSDPFDRAMFLEIIQNPSASERTLTRKIAYRARILTIAAAIATLISIVLLLIFAHMSKVTPLGCEAGSTRTHMSAGIRFASLIP